MISKELKEVWETLRPRQKRFVIEYQKCQSKKEAAEAVNIKPMTAYGWGDNIDKAIDLLEDERLHRINDRLELIALSAVERLPDIIDSDSDSVSLSAIKYAIDQAIGKATRKVEQKNEDISSIDLNIINEE